MDPIYCIPGLGVDSRIFSPLASLLPLKYLHWMEPLHSRESLPAYSQRINEQLPQDQPVCLLGLSFGGIIAMEIARLRPVTHLILVSSLSNASEKPFWLKLFYHLPLYQLSRGNLRIHTIPLWAPRQGIQSEAELALLRAMFSGFSSSYRMWAIRSFAHWQGQAPEAIPLLHLHGDQDKVFPHQKIQKAHRIKGGNHFMVYQKAEELADNIDLFMSQNQEQDSISLWDS